MRILRDILILFLIVALTLIVISFSLGISISAIHITLVLPICYLLAYNWQSEKKINALLLAIFFSILLVSIAVISSLFLVDDFFDSRSYHGPAVIALSDGWNPIQKWHVCSWSADHCMPTHRLVDHYPKSQRYLAAGSYSLVGNLDVGKSVNLLMLFLCLIVSFEFASELLPGRTITPLLVAITITANPVALAQLFSGYVDGLLASTFSIFAMLLVGYLLTNETKRLYQAALILPYLINLKFTGLAYGIIFAAFLFIYLFVKNRDFPKDMFLVLSISTGTAIVLIGFNPYISNLIEKHNPLYPVLSPSTREDIFDKQGDKRFSERNRFEGYIMACFSTIDPENRQYSV